MAAPTLSDLDLTILTPIVRTLLESKSAEVSGWRVIPITQGRASAAGVYRVTGMALEQGETVPWSLVVKVVAAEALSSYSGNNASNTLTHQWYWKRELLLYQSGLFDGLPNGLAAPRCYHIDEQLDQSRIWMEDVAEDVGAIWPLAHYRNVARHFGRFNGLYLGQRALPTWPWLFTNFYVQWTEKSSWPEFWENYPRLRNESELVQRGWSDELVNGFQRLWQERHQFINALDQLPQTLHHNDSGRKNLIANQRGDDEIVTVALDWAQPGIGAVGGELSCLISQSVYWFHGVRPDQLRELDEIVFPSYVEGLRDAGWQGDARLARLGYTASMALRAGFAIFIFEWAARDESTRQFIENAVGHSMEEIVDVMRGFRSYVLDCADEARGLMASIPITID